jgi:hypothetical protein
MAEWLSRMEEQEEAVPGVLREGPEPLRGVEEPAATEYLELAEQAEAEPPGR